jgi:hypothetical protein
VHLTSATAMATDEMLRPNRTQGLPSALCASALQRKCRASLITSAHAHGSSAVVGLAASALDPRTSLRCELRLVTRGKTLTSVRLGASDAFLSPHATVTHSVPTRP